MWMVDLEYDIEPQFEPQEVAKTFIERANERKNGPSPAGTDFNGPTPAVGGTSNPSSTGYPPQNRTLLTANNPHTANNVAASTQNICQCATSRPMNHGQCNQLMQQPQCHQTMQQQPGQCCQRNLQVLVPTSLCCACRLMQMWPVCSCSNQATTATPNNNNHNKGLQIEEAIKNAPRRKERPQPRRINRAADNANKVIPMQAVIRKYNYEALKPKHYDFDIAPLPRLPDRRFELPLVMPERIPTIPFHYRPSVGLSRR